MGPRGVAPPSIALPPPMAPAMAPLVRLAPTPSPDFLLHFTGASSSEYPAPFTPPAPPSRACADSRVEFGDRRLSLLDAGPPPGAPPPPAPSSPSSESPRISPATTSLDRDDTLAAPISARLARSCSWRSAIRLRRSVISLTCARENLACGSGSGSGGSGLGVDAGPRLWSRVARKFSTGCR